MILAVLVAGAVGAYLGGKVGRVVGIAEGAAIGLIPVASDPSLAAAYEASLTAHGVLKSPEDHEGFQAALEMARRYGRGGFGGFFSKPEHVVPVLATDLATMLQLSPEQQDILHQHIAQVPAGGRVPWQAEDMIRDLQLSPQQADALRGMDHPQAAAAAGALWTEHGYRLGEDPTAVPPIYTAYDAQPSAEDIPSPSKAFSFSLPPQKLDAVRSGNTGMNQAISTLLTIGVMPRWVLQTANRFVQAHVSPGAPVSPIHTAYDTHDPSAEDSPSPSKAFSFSLPPDQLASVAAANTAMHQAIDTLLSTGVKPRWVLQTANRFVHAHMLAAAQTHTPAATAGALWTQHGSRPFYPGAAVGALWTHHGYGPVYDGYFGPGR